MAEPSEVTDGVLCLADVNVDVVLRLPTGETLHPPRVTGGGSAANTAVTLQRLGVAATFCGTVGADGFGRWAVAELRASGVATDISMVDDATVAVMVVVDRDGERYTYVHPHEGGAHFALTPDHLPGGSARWLHVSGICLREEPAASTLLEAMRRTGDAGGTVSFDLNLRLENWGWGSMRRHVTDAIALSDVVLADGAGELLPVTGIGDIPDAARSLRRPVVVARCGTDGAVVVVDGDAHRVPAFTVDALDTAGAGDAFDAGFIAARLDGVDPVEATRWGNATAALAVAVPGTRPDVSRDEVARIVG